MRSIDNCAGFSRGAEQVEEGLDHCSGTDDETDSLVPCHAYRRLANHVCACRLDSLMAPIDISQPAHLSFK